MHLKEIQIKCIMISKDLVNNTKTKRTHRCKHRLQSQQQQGGGGGPGGPESRDTETTAQRGDAEDALLDALYKQAAPNGQNRDINGD